MVPPTVELLERIILRALSIRERAWSLRTFLKVGTPQVLAVGVSEVAQWYVEEPVTNSLRITAPLVSRDYSY